MNSRTDLLRTLGILQKHLLFSRDELYYWDGKLFSAGILLQTDATDDIIDLYLKAITQVQWVTNEIDMLENGIYQIDQELKGIKT